MSIIHEPIHGDIKLSEIALKIIDHPYFDRTHYIYQTGIAYRIYPSATHSRKVHMIGTYAITSKLLEHLNVDSNVKELICIGALCHDIGHGPGSHGFDKHVIQKLISDEKIQKNNSWILHEQRSVDMFREMAQDLDLQEDEIDFICKVIDPPIGEKRWEFNIVNNTQHGIDTDKLDYIARDGYVLGLRLSIDFDQIIKNSRIVDGQWAFSKSIQDELLNVIFVRYRLHRILNQSRIVKFDLSYRNIITNTPKMYSDIAQILNNHDIKGFTKYTDHYVLQNGKKNLVKKFNQRDAYTIVDKKSDNSDDEDVVTLNIKICNVDSNPMANIPFYDPKTLELCDITKTSIDKALPCNEVMSYVYKYDSNEL
tara:strand:+ start:1441 stop:2541 length:1101 start_codon:yes stop_codon:yes gene_type:complete